MSRTIARLVLAALVSLTVLPASAVTIDTVLVDQPGNPNDPLPFHGIGRVDYTYRIGKYDVTNSQYVEFLNAKDPLGQNTLALYDYGMSDYPYGGIIYDEQGAGGARYSVVPGYGSHPVNYVSWYSAVRFANWVNNGQGNASTETGSYTLGALGPDGVPLNGASIVRNGGAHVVLPNIDEWHKAAYYGADWHDYPFAGSYPPAFPPTGGLPPGTMTAVGNFTDGGPLNLTDVGAYTFGYSSFGAYDMGGNVAQWTEGLSGAYRTIQGTSFMNVAEDSKLIPFLFPAGAGNPTLAISDVGFRLAIVPEPSALALGFFAVVAIGLVAVRCE